jgi:hypothetical protein
MTRFQMFLAIVATILASLWFAHMVAAQEARPFSYRWYKKDLYWGKFHCGGEYRPEGCWRRRAEHRFWPRPVYHAPEPDSEIMAAQIRLKELGLYRDEIDGLNGPATRKAVERFQADNDLRVSGELDDNTTDALKSNDREHFHDDNDRDRSRCLSNIVYALSRHSTSEANAKSSAQERWMDLVQASRGGVYMNLQLAQDTKWRCFQSQAHSSFLGKAQELGSKIVGGEGHHMMCEVWARPCAAPVERNGD